MGVISYQRPRKTGSVSVYKNLAQPVNKVDLVSKYGLEINPPDNDIVQCSGRIYSVFRGRTLTFPDPFVKFSQASPQALKRTAGYRTIIIDGLVKSSKMPFSVIPAKAGIQFIQVVTIGVDSGFHRSDDFL